MFTGVFQRSCITLVISAYTHTRSKELYKLQALYTCSTDLLNEVSTEVKVNVHLLQLMGHNFHPETYLPRHIADSILNVT